jgi:hypothetical protein
MHFTVAIKKARYCPTFIDGVLTESFYPGVYDEGMSANWHYAGPGETLAALPAKIMLITKDKRYDFDFRSAFNGHIVSKRFLSVFRALKTGRWEVAELEIRTPKGEKSIADNYYFIRQRVSDQETIEIIDSEHSTIDYRKNGEIKHISRLVVKPAIELDFFSIYDTSLLGYLFLSSAAAETLKNIDLKGAEIVSAEEIGDIEQA